MAEQAVASFHAECYAKAKGLDPRVVAAFARKKRGTGEVCAVCGQVIGYWYRVTEQQQTPGDITDAH